MSTAGRAREFLERDYLLGDWGGWRTKLSRKGIDFEFFYGGSVPENLDGGIRRGGVYQGALLMTLDLNSEKLVGYEGGQFHVGSIWLHGEKPFSDKYVGDLNKVNLLDFKQTEGRSHHRRYCVAFPRRRRLQCASGGRRHGHL